MVFKIDVVSTKEMVVKIEIVLKIDMVQPRQKA
jgi:hypothetical protein